MQIKRRQNGSAIAELGPALFVILLSAFFPLLDLIAMGVSFGSVWYVNNLCTSQLCLARQSQMQSVIDTVDNAFVQTGIAQFIGISDPSAIHHQVSYNNTPGSGAPPTVLCTTTMSTKPLVSIPFFAPIVGLNTPISFTASTERPREETRN